MIDQKKDTKAVIIGKYNEKSAELSSLKIYLSKAKNEADDLKNKLSKVEKDLSVKSVAIRDIMIATKSFLAINGEYYNNTEYGYIQTVDTDNYEPDKPYVLFSRYLLGICDEALKEKRGY